MTNDLRIAFTVKDSDGMIVHKFSETTLSASNFVSATGCNHSSTPSLNCLIADDKHFNADKMLANEEGLANWTKPKGGPTHGCIVSQGQCVPFEGGDDFDLIRSGIYRFPSNVFSTRAVTWPLLIQLQKLEFRSAATNVADVNLTPLNSFRSPLRLMLTPVY